MMQYQVYQLYQTTRPKSAMEIRHADEQLGRMAQNVSGLWQRAAQPLSAALATLHSRLPGRAILAESTDGR